MWQQSAARFSRREMGAIDLLLRSLPANVNHDNRESCIDKEARRREEA